MVGDYPMQHMIDRLLTKIDETLGQVVRNPFDADVHSEFDALSTPRPTHELTQGATLQTEDEKRAN